MFNHFRNTTSTFTEKRQSSLIPSHSYLTRFNFYCWGRDGSHSPSCWLLVVLFDFTNIFGHRASVCLSNCEAWTAPRRPLFVFSVSAVIWPVCEYSNKGNTVNASFYYLWTSHSQLCRHKLRFCAVSLDVHRLAEWIEGRQKLPSRLVRTWIKNKDRLHGGCGCFLIFSHTSLTLTQPFSRRS